MIMHIILEWMFDGLHEPKNKELMLWTVYLWWTSIRLHSTPKGILKVANALARAAQGIIWGDIA